ncbi:hypothetical protein AB0870_12255 [Microbacterium proteolyticum]|nr:MULTISPECIES: hypothetical protein [Microbacteriaceae]PJJ55467.1 hypothetical protein CLV54_2811 [Compostimonas suwonensis]
MELTTRPGRRTRLILALIAAGLLLILAGVGVYGLLAGPRRDAPPAPAPSTSSTPNPSETFPTADEPAAVRLTHNPEQFARSVAATLFTWDAGAGYGPLDIADVLLEVVETSTGEQNGLASDITGYLPTSSAWAQLRGYATRQSLTIDSIGVPDGWADALAQARPGQLLPGTTAFTIDATRHRTGIWNGQQITSEHPVSFTVFIVCSPPAPEFSTGPCRLLRLSQLDNPLR